MSGPSDLFTQTITYKTPASVSSYGDPTFSASAEIPARIEHVRRVVYGVDGIAESTVTVFTAIEVPRGSRIWFADEDETNETEGHKVISAEYLITPDGSVAYYEASL